MMRLARRASLLVVFSLLTSAATAYAECAWVLWERWFSQGTGDSWTAVGVRYRNGHATEQANRNMPKRSGRAWSGTGER